MHTSRFLIFLGILAGCAVSPEDGFKNWSELDSFKRGWYSEQLVAANEKSIALPVKAPIYRFIWLRTFHHPVIIKIECPDQCVMEAKMLSGAGGYEPGSLSERKRRMLTPEEKLALLNSFGKVNFWAPAPEADVIGNDGAEWVLEVAQGNIYRAWTVWGPYTQPEFKAYYEFCSHLISFSGFNIPPNEFY